MNFTNIKLTQNQQLIANALLSMLASAFVAAAQATYQYLTQRGTINLQQALLVFVGALWTFLSVAFIAYIPAHAQQELEALRELQQQVTSQPATPAQPLVIIHTNAAPTVAGARVQSVTDTVTKSEQPSVQPVPLLDVQPVPRANNATALPVVASDDLLGDLPQASGTAPDVKQITGVIPTYGASGK